MLQVVAEAAQHLQLEVLVRRAEPAVLRDGMGDRAQVVAGDGGPDGRPRLQQADREVLEVAVRVGLDLEDRRVPAVLSCFDDLVVPVGALDEADGQRRRAVRVRCPRGDPVTQGGGVAQVGLQHEPGRRAVPELVFGEQFEHEIRDCLVRIEGLHVDVQVRAALRRAA